MKWFILFNVLSGILYLVTKIKWLTLHLFLTCALSCMMNLFTMPVLLLGELGADKRQHKAFYKLGGSYKGYFIYSTLETLYICLLYVFSVMFFGSHPFMLVIFYLVYKIFDLSRLAYIISHSQAWTWIIISSYIIGAVSFFY